MSENVIAEVLLDQNLDRPLDYEVPAMLREQIHVGVRVEVPIRSSLKKGTVSLLKSASEYPVRPLVRLLLDASLPEPLWKLALWISRYYCCSLQRVLKCLTPPNIRKDVRPKTQLRASLSITHAEALKLCEALRAKQSGQALVLETLLNAPKPIAVVQLMRDLSVTRAPIDALKKKGAVKLEAVAESLGMAEADFFPTHPKTLNSEQAACLEKISKDLGENRFAAHLIRGITGSGKTEVYLQAMQQALDQGKSALLLVPEISLTTQTIERFRARFGLKLAIFHHRRSLGERTAAWEALKSGEVKIAIGARSAIFCPAQNLGLIIIDEEHDSSYKQTEEMPTYHARDVAVMRAKLENAVVVLGSATPSLESFHNAEIGKYTLSTLSTRATSASLPKVQIIDLKRAYDRAGGFTHFCQELLDGIKERWDKGEQTLLLLNRRGYHRLQMCAACKHTVKCPHCDLSLTYHRGPNELRCHLCDYQSPLIRECPACKSPASMEFRGFGTEHVERSLHAIFPGIRTLRMDRDTTRQKESHDEMFKQFRSHKADVLIGTQMIAKGFHFPSVTLVGVLNADASLQIPDYRAAESLFQLITQVAGRAGRAELSGEVILQTFLPDHPLLHLAAKQDYLAFYARECEERRLFSFPPFSRLVKLVFSGSNEAETVREAERFRQALLPSAPADAQFLPPLPAGHAKVKDLYRIQFIIKTFRVKPLSERLSALRGQYLLPKGISLLIDVDPLSTFF